MSKSWKLVHIKNHPENIGEQWGVVQTDKYAFDVIAMESDKSTREQFTKDVKIIAAAQDLLKALTDISKDNYDDDDDLVDLANRFEECKRIALEAIKKATE